MESSAIRLLRNSRREAAAVLVIWLGFLVWVITSSTILGYEASGGATTGAAAPQDLKPGGAPIPLRAGLPLWIYWGIAVPWVAATLSTVFFGARLLRDDDLGLEREESKAAG